MTKERYKIPQGFLKKVICTTVTFSILLFLQYESFVYLANAYRDLSPQSWMIITTIPTVIIGILLIRRMLRKGCVIG